MALAKGCRLPLLLFALSNAGCAMSHTDRGVLAGSGLGAIGGGLIGSQSGKAGPGALIGGVLGGIAGGLTGAAIDDSERRAAAHAARQPPLTPVDIIRLTREGVGNDVIITQIRTTGSVYALTAQDIINLRGHGVHDAVIQEMQQTALRPVMVEPVYVIPGPPPPPIGVGVGVSFGRRCR